MKTGLKKVLVVAIVLVAIFYGIQLCFWLLNMASSFANVLGFVGLVGMATIAYYEGRDIIEDFLNNK